MSLHDVRRLIRVMSNGYIETLQEPLAAESPVTLMLNGREFVTIVASPTDLEDLAYGFLASEGIIARATDVTVLTIDLGDGRIWARIPGLSENAARFGQRVLTSCCGRSRPTFYFLNDSGLGPLDTRLRLTPGQIRRLMTTLDELSQEFHATGGVHTAALTHGETLDVARSDVGRHNALDKVLGWCVRQNINAHDRAVIFSGRISSEVVIKVARMGAGIIISNAAPTSLGLDFAQELHITTIGFARDGRFNVYTHHDRVLLDRMG